ncbi:hypothetical protein ASG49_00150 [Marmoricola sp. Leaf446]|uniref:DUF58 domain-containing protein n=1 Tax=Marmoricola sp. Leaf446 TaxID=1736379 RepID=UPI0006F2BF98|nr:DUF58 domain-containing protein [Marmoricola sp. Leaf446]KQT93478.1 hypothetical protein ASG49_00150 [Marmoricola sp. Leaf446]
MRSLTEAQHALRTIELAVHRRLAGRRLGSHGGIALGPGTDPEEVVRYRPGEDDVRRIDWNATARSQEPHVWRTRAEHELEVWVLVDETASMDFGTVEVEKGELAAWVTGAVGLLTDAPGNRLGVAHLGHAGVTWSPPERPRRAALRALARPATRPPCGREESPAPARTGLAAALVELGRRQRRPGTRVVVTDFVEPDGAAARPFPWETALRRLASRHDVVVVEVLDPRELELPDVGPVVLVDPESGHRCEVWTSLPRLRQQYAELAHAHRAAVADAVRSSGARHLVVRTDRDWVADLVHFVRADRRPAGRRAAVPRSPR